MKSRGPERPEDDADERRAKGRRWGRGKAEAEPEEPVSGEEFGWIDDLRTAKAQRTELGPEDGPGPEATPRAATPPVRRGEAEPPRARPGAGPWPGSPAAPGPGHRGDVPPAGPRSGPPAEAAGRRAPGWPQDGPDRPRPVSGPGAPAAPSPRSRPPAGPPPAAGPRGAAPGGPPPGGPPHGPQTQPGRQPQPGPHAPGPHAQPGAAPGRSGGRGGVGVPGPQPGPRVGPPAAPAGPTGSPVGPHVSVPPPSARRPDARGADPADGHRSGDLTGSAARARVPRPGPAASPAGDPAARPGPVHSGPVGANAGFGRHPGDVSGELPDAGARGGPRSRPPAPARRPAAGPDEPVVPRSGNAPPVPGLVPPAGRSGGEEPTGRRATPAGDTAAPRGRRAAPDGDLTAPRGRRAAPDGDLAAPRGRRAAPDGDLTASRGRRAAPDDAAARGAQGTDAAGAGPRPEGADRPATEGRRARPERPADWLRQAGRTPHHTDPSLRTLNAPATPPGSAVTPQSAPPAGRRAADTGRASGSDPAGGGTDAGRLRSGRSGPVDAPAGRGAARPDGRTPGAGTPNRPHPPAGPAAERPRPSAAAAGGTAEPRPAGPGDRPFRPDVPPRARPDAGPVRGAAAPPRPGAPVSGPAAGGPTPPGVARPGAAGRGAATPPDVGRPGAAPPGPRGAAVPPGAARPGPAPDVRGAAPVPGPGRPPADEAFPEPTSGGPRPAAGVARPAGPRPGPDERAHGRALPPQREPGRPEPTGMPPVPPPAAPGEPAVARASVAPPPAAAVPPDAAPLRRPTEADGATAAGGLSGARSELRRQMRERRRLRMGVLALVSIVLLGAVPLFFGLRTLSRDPVFDTLDKLDVPSWAATETVDDVSGSRWCLLDCRLRERTVESERSPEETAQVYEAALVEDGWRPWKVERCPEQEEKGSYTCWRRDELTLDLWVRPPTCVPPPVDGEPAVVPSPDPSTAAQECSGSLVSVKVRNAIDDDRTRPQPSTDPSLTGEDPFPTLSEDPLGELTPSPS